MNRNQDNRSPRSVLGTLRLAAVIAPIALCCGCGADHLTETTSYPTDFTVSVSSGTSPTISWSGGNATSFSVQDYGANTLTGDDTWYFFGSGYDGSFAPPVHYGQMPAGADCGILDGESYCPNAIPLTKGHTYLVIIIRADFKIGAAIFKP